MRTRQSSSEVARRRRGWGPGEVLDTGGGMYDTLEYGRAGECGCVRELGDGS